MNDIGILFTCIFSYRKSYQHHSFDFLVILPFLFYLFVVFLVVHSVLVVVYSSSFVLIA
jgi:hypothetical protein